MVTHELTDRGRALLGCARRRGGHRASAPIELPTFQPAAAASTPTISGERYARLAGRVKLLSWLSLARRRVEGVVGISAAIIAGSIAMIDLDSGIEGLASVIGIWRFTGAHVFSHAAE